MTATLVAQAGTSAATYKGDWAAATAYIVGDTVTNPAGALVARTTAGTSAATYVLDSLYWEPLSTSHIADVRTFGAKCDAKRLLDGAGTSGSTTFTSATAAFTQADVGKRIYIYGADVAGALLRRTIGSVQSATQITLSGGIVQTTVSNAEFHYGTDDATAINNAIASGAPVVFIPDSCIVTTPILPRTGMVLRGAGTHVDPGVFTDFTGTTHDRANGYYAPTTIVSLYSSQAMAIDVQEGMYNWAIEELAIVMPQGTTPQESRTAGSMGIRVRDNVASFRISNVDGSYGTNGIVIKAATRGVLRQVHWRDARVHNLLIEGAADDITTDSGCLFQVADYIGASTANALTLNPANVAIVSGGTGTARNIKFGHRLWDETGVAPNHSCLYADAVKDLTVSDFLMYPPNGYGIYLGANCVRVTIRKGRIEPYPGGGRDPQATIYIASGATGVVLEDISTDPAAGTDIVDLGTGTVWRNVNGISKDARFTTAARPSASTYGDGARIYDTDLNKPLWSDGSAWRDAAGTAV